MNSISLTNMILNLPFTSLRAFEAVARHASFSGAADELGVSQSAVSQHVKSLEDWLGHALLTRGARRSQPNRDGARLAQAIAEGLGRISDVCEDIRDKRRADNTIVISCLPGFAFVWLFPRLMNFDLMHPDLSISITTDSGTGGFAEGQADIGIRYGTGHNPGFVVEKLMQEDVFPVCSPALLRGPHPLNDVADLVWHTQLRDEYAPYTTTPPNWEYWARENRLSLPTPARTRRFGQSNLVIQAAIQGIGVALGRGPLVMDALHGGRLVRPFSQTARSPLAYWLVYGEAQKKSDKIARFINWIKREAAQQPPLPASLKSKPRQD
ncbi:LysR substrate-binding domain-containing protein [Puniceibacterium sp. IMCC21224]|uniref:LysR substrate-binding domain-containing protein n=1 Tax=Puniceibacterium sp. IMCC21224 TaxID=1618204 RepID=UPI001E2D9AFE|nr:LysR substrate-binding domain-containing protein [Puniceibacterium sp. IMCC21224]